MKAIFFSVLFFLSAASARSGFESGNGGDAYASEFVWTGMGIAQALKAVDQKPGPMLVDAHVLAAAVSMVEVVTEETVFLNGFERDAVNDPDNLKILLSRKRWSVLRLASQFESRVRLVLHEYLGVIGYDDSNYRISGPLVEKMNKDGKLFIPNEVINPVNDVLVTMYNNKNEVCADVKLEFDFEQDKDRQVGWLEGCRGRFRRVTIRKTMAHSDDGAAGTMARIHSFEIEVYDDRNQMLNRLKYVPQLRSCNVDTKACFLSGDIRVHDVNVKFLYWMRPMKEDI